MSLQERVNSFYDQPTTQTSKQKELHFQEKEKVVQVCQERLRYQPSLTKGNLHNTGLKTEPASSVCLGWSRRKHILC